LIGATALNNDTLADADVAPIPPFPLHRKQAIIGHEDNN